MKKINTQMVAVAALVAGLGLASSAHADWTFNSTGAIAGTGGNSGTSVSTTGAYATNGGTLPSGAIGTTIVAAGTACSVSICGSAAGNANTYGVSGFASSATTWTVAATGGTSNTGSSLTLYPGNGLGQSSDSLGSNQPNHALDNGVGTDANDKISSVGNTEAVLLSFSSSVSLAGVGIGYKFGDADISLFRYVGSTSVAPSFNGTNATTMSGWELVGNYGDLAVNTSTYNTVNASGKGSSWWLITAYNSVYGAATTGSVDQGNDYFKLYAVAGTSCTATGVGNTCNNQNTSVPEPTSLALVAIAGLGAVGARRRKVKAAA